MRRLTVVFILIITLLIPNNLYNQSIRNKKIRNNTFHPFGVSYVHHVFESGQHGSFAFTYSPRYNIYQASRTSTISISTHLTLGYNTKFICTTPYAQSSIMFELPISMDLNFGHGATKRTKTKAGGFFGAGYAVSSMKNMLDEPNDVYELTSITQGAYANVGMRFRLKENSSANIMVYGIYGTNEAIITGARLQIYFYQFSRW